jgi:hypothetical protein
VRGWTAGPQALSSSARTETRPNIESLVRIFNSL